MATAIRFVDAQAQYADHCRDLIAAILVQAVNDALAGSSGATLWITNCSHWFTKYCELIGIEPTYVKRSLLGMQQQGIKHIGLKRAKEYVAELGS